MDALTAYCVEVGSFKTGRFAWARSARHEEGPPATGTDIDALVQRLADDLEKRRPVALGLTAPLWLPIRAEPEDLTSSRPGEGNRSWSAGAGPTALVTGVVEASWMLARLRGLLEDEPPVFVGLDAFRDVGRGLLLWEAFPDGRVAKDAPTGALASDAVMSFLDGFSGFEAPEHTEPILSLAGTVLMRTGWVRDPRILGEAPLLLRVTPGMISEARAAKAVAR